jgi:hypothetical protein
MTTGIKNTVFSIGGMLERHSDKLARENPNVIFRFLNEVTVSRGFGEGNLFLTNHCTLSELVYYQNSNKIFFPLKADPEKLIKKSYTHQDIIREPATDSYNEAISFIAKGEYVKAAAQFYMLFGYCMLVIPNSLPGR